MLEVFECPYSLLERVCERDELNATHNTHICLQYRYSNQFAHGHRRSIEQPPIPQIQRAVAQTRNHSSVCVGWVARLEHVNKLIEQDLRYPHTPRVVTVKPYGRDVLAHLMNVHVYYCRCDALQTDTPSDGLWALEPERPERPASIRSVSAIKLRTRASASSGS
jgi:hypothetical protein